MEHPRYRTSFRIIIVPLVCLALATGAWLPLLHVLFAPPYPARSHHQTISQQMMLHQLSAVESPELRASSRMALRLTNPEWDLMARTFLSLSLTTVAVDPGDEQERYLRAVDLMLADTLAQEKEHGQPTFLLAYVHAGAFVQQPPRSLFVDGEIALMLAARLLVRDDTSLRQILRDRIDLMVNRMEQSPTLSSESYPDECWTFCNTIALAAIRMSDRVDGRDHSSLLRSWVDHARQHLVDPETRLLWSSYTLDGRKLDGPEASSIFLAAHMLQTIDPGFAEEQYQRAQHLLLFDVLGFGLAREWPGGISQPDIDSGPVLLALGASAGASGMAVLGAAAFGDEVWMQRLGTSLSFAGFPVAKSQGMTYAAGNGVGDAVLLYSHVLATQGGQSRLFAQLNEAKP